jgi:hypothetical protein
MMTFIEFLDTDKIDIKQKDFILSSTLQTLIDANWPGVKLERLSKEHTLLLTQYVSDHYNFRFVNGDIMNSVIAEPKELFQKD